MKGVAILMMLWHHCFLAGRYEAYAISFWPLEANQVMRIAAFFKICVALFAFVSGYELFLSYKNSNQRSPGKWVVTRYVRTLSDYWFVVVISWIVCTLIDGLPLRTYGGESSPILTVWNAFLDFFGLSNLFGSQLLNGTWWYMGAAVAFITLMPLLFKVLERAGSICVVGILIIFIRICIDNTNGTSFLNFLLSFCLGMVFARHDLFEKWAVFWNKLISKQKSIYIVKFALMSLALFSSYKLFQTLPTNNWWDIKWNLIPLVVIIFVNDYIVNTPVIGHILAFLGKHATNIFLVHTFIRHYYCQEFVYSVGHFLMVIGVLLLVSLAISFALDFLKKLVKYDILINKLLSRFALAK